MKKVRLLFLLGLLILLSLCGCGPVQEVPEEGFMLYYISPGETKLVAQPYELQATNTQAQAEEVIAQLSQIPDKLEYKAPLAMGFQIRKFELSEGKISLDMNEDYQKLSTTTEVLVRAALVQSLVQLQDVNLVGITVEENPLYDSVGELVGWMNKDQFIYNDGNEINTYEMARVKLYFVNEEGDKLIANYREKHYSTNTPLERFVVEELIAGPSGQVEGIFPSVNPETKIINVMTKDGICYVNLDSSFLTVVNNVSTEVSIYAIVDSLVELNNVSKVQILINGEVPAAFSNNTFERNLEYVASVE